MTSSAIMTSTSASLGSPAGSSSSQYLHPDYIQMMPSSVSIHTVLHLRTVIVKCETSPVKFEYSSFRASNANLCSFTLRSVVRFWRNLGKSHVEFLRFLL